MRKVWCHGYSPRSRDHRSDEGQVRRDPDPEALEFLADLHRRFGRAVRSCSPRAERRQEEISAGANLDFLPETKAIREDPDWRVAPPAPGLVDRRVEITGPTDRKMTINALNSGAKVWLADFEDANTPLWENMIEGQLNLRDALDRTIDFTSPEGKRYALKDDAELATIVVRPRGWHLDEKHILVDGQRTSGGIVDFALYFFHCARRQIAKGKGPYFYLPKMQSHLEARLWNDIFIRAQEALGINGAPSAPPCSSRPSPPPSKWRRSSTSCGSTPQGSMPAAGTTCSASSRSSARAAASS